MFTALVIKVLNHTYNINVTGTEECRENGQMQFLLKQVSECLLEEALKEVEEFDDTVLWIIIGASLFAVVVLCMMIWLCCTSVKMRDGDIEMMIRGLSRQDQF